jgi:tetratricopeptide (TPR) repeat protein
LIDESRGDRDGAVKEYEQVLTINPRAGVAANNLAWIYAETGKLDDAVRLATVAKEAMPDRPEPLDTLGWAYYKKGRYTHALSAFEQAVQRNAENAIYHYHLGLANLKAGEPARARAALQRALQLKSDFPGANDARGILMQVASRNP